MIFELSKKMELKIPAGLAICGTYAKDAKQRLFRLYQNRQMR